MRVLPAGMAAHLASGATTLCHCWRVTLTSGEKLGFTDHDQVMSFDGTTFEADSGFTATEMESSLGLSIDNLEASGALSSARISETRIAAGDFDDAKVEIWRVNWQDVTQRLLLKSGYIGEITRGQYYFSAELRGLAHVLNQQKGRLYKHGCDAVLGDGRCGINLSSSTYSAIATIVGVDNMRVLRVTGVGSFARGFFANGVAEFTSGTNNGRKWQIKFSRLRTGYQEIELWQPLAQPSAAGDLVRVKAGCDKQFATCKAKFNNVVNFRGFPHIPGNDNIMRVGIPNTD